MHNEPDEKFEIEIGRNWPEQVIVDHAPYWRAWRRQVKPISKVSEETYDVAGRAWVAFANGKNLGPRLMLEWIKHVTSFPSNKNSTGVICNRRAEKYRFAVTAYLRWLYLMGAITQDPSGCMPKLNATPSGPKFIFTHEEYLRMVKFGTDHGGHATALWLVILGYHTGMSLVDCCTLRWEQVELPDDGPCFISRVRSKMASRLGTKAVCTIPILAGSELWVWFKKLQRQAKYEGVPAKDFVCNEAAELALEYRPGPTFMMTHYISDALGEDRKARTFRHLRNTFASRLINSGADSVLVSKMTGHQTLTQLAAYVIPDQATMQAAVLKGLRHVEGKTILPAETKNQSDICQNQ